MGSANQIDVVLHSEFANDLLSKSETHSAVVVSEFLDTSLWIGPEQVTQQSGVRHIGWSNYVFDLLEVFQFW